MTLVLILAPAVAALAVLAGILLGLSDRIASRPPEARRSWALLGAALACVALGLVIAALAVAAGVQT